MCPPYRPPVLPRPVLDQAAFDERLRALSDELASPRLVLVVEREGETHGEDGCFSSSWSEFSEKISLLRDATLSEKRDLVHQGGVEISGREIRALAPGSTTFLFLSNLVSSFGTDWHRLGPHLDCWWTDRGYAPLDAPDVKAVLEHYQSSPVWALEIAVGEAAIADWFVLRPDTYITKLWQLCSELSVPVPSSEKFAVRLQAALARLDARRDKATLEVQVAESALEQAAARLREHGAVEKARQERESLEIMVDGLRAATRT